MRKIREVLRLSRVLGLSQRQVARSVHLGQSTVWDYLMRFRVSGLSWEEVAALDDEVLERRGSGSTYARLRRLAKGETLLVFHKLSGGAAH
jgi:hypothetical protein